VIPTGPAAAVGNGWSDTVPSRSTRPIAFAWLSVNHSASPGPDVIIDGNAPCSGRSMWVTVPSAVMRPIRSLFISVNRRARP
jgi:hypothetical protein